MKQKITKEELIEFEDKIKQLWEEAKIPYPVHLCGGNENQLIEIFQEINEGDYILSTHRSHYHYLLAGGSKDKLKEIILRGDSMHVFDRELNFITSSIVSGNCGIAVGIAMALKKKEENKHVWCFVGDGAEDEGHFYESVRYVDGYKLPCTFIIEDNNRSVETQKKDRYGSSEINWPSCVRRYNFIAKYPHVGSGGWVNFKDGVSGGVSF